MEESNGSGLEAPAVRICPACYGAQNFGALVCAFCGAPFPKKSREVEQVAGELAEVNQEQLALKLKWKRDQGAAQGYPELVALAKARGYKNPNGYAWTILRARRAKRAMADSK